MVEIHHSGRKTSICEDLRLRALSDDGEEENVEERLCLIHVIISYGIMTVM